ncbi:helix-turn-helix domain-containing protein [Mycobacterium intracellulare]|uniref:helix-turn-helix domain-containing protein n=1 Tax=Mycobacterium intracellulare TaxID=1767 RepID=UPI001E28FCD7|nr:helix-turn-helix domain-containing protein [Mycobacterium intracellulare]
MRRHPCAVGVRPAPPHPRPRRCGDRRAARRVRCDGCGTTQILLPAALQPRRADTTEVIGIALARKATGLGHRRIAAALGRSPSTVRRWCRRARDCRPSQLAVATRRPGTDPARRRRIQSTDRHR